FTVEQVFRTAPLPTGCAGTAFENDDGSLSQLPPARFELAVRKLNLLILQDCPSMCINEGECIAEWHGWHDMAPTRSPSSGRFAFPINPRRLRTRYASIRTEVGHPLGAQKILVEQRPARQLLGLL